MTQRMKVDGAARTIDAGASSLPAFLEEASKARGVLTMHPDPLVRAGVMTSLRQHAAFEVVEPGPDPMNWDGCPIAVVIAEFQQAMQLAELAFRQQRRSLAAARIMVLTSNDRETDIRRAVAAGVHGYLLLGEPLNELIEGVAALANGIRYLGRSVAQRMADSLARASLTSREFEVLRLVTAGEGNKAIARVLQIEVGTVKTHMHAILSKLNATSRTQAAAIAVARGLVEERMGIPSAVSAHAQSAAPHPAAEQMLHFRSNNGAFHRGSFSQASQQPIILEAN